MAVELLFLAIAVIFVTYSEVLWRASGSRLVPRFLMSFSMGALGLWAFLRSLAGIVAAEETAILLLRASIVPATATLLGFTLWVRYISNRSVYSPYIILIFAAVGIMNLTDLGVTGIVRTSNEITFESFGLAYGSYVTLFFGSFIYALAVIRKKALNRKSDLISKDARFILVTAMALGTVLVLGALLPDLLGIVPTYSVALLEAMVVSIWFLGFAIRLHAQSNQIDGYRLNSRILFSAIISTSLLFVVSFLLAESNNLPPLFYALLGASVSVILIVFVRRLNLFLQAVDFESTSKEAGMWQRNSSRELQISTVQLLDRLEEDVQGVLGDDYGVSIGVVGKSLRSELIERNGEETIFTLPIDNQRVATYAIRHPQKRDLSANTLRRAIYVTKEATALIKLHSRLAAQRRDSDMQALRYQEESTRKDEFISMASHQLRSPLTLSLLTNKMIIEGAYGAVTERQMKALKESVGNIERMNSIVSELLDAARIEQGSFEINSQDVDISQLIAECISFVEKKALAKGVKIVRTGLDKSSVLAIDEAKIREVVMNILENAVKYSPANSTINVFLKQDSNKLVLRVQDEGMGVPLQDQKLLFTKYGRASNAKDVDAEGLGLGLYLAHKVVDLHGGEMVYEPLPGKGSEFGFIIPVE